MHEYQVGPDRVAAARIGSGCVNTTATLATMPLGKAGDLKYIASFIRFYIN